MILYHCVSAYHVIQAMVHRRQKFPAEKAVLMLAAFSVNKFADYRELNNFFDEIILFPYREIAHNTDTIVSDTAKLYEEHVRYEIWEFDEIYVAAAHYYFSLYLIANHVRFHFMEDGGGILSKPKVSYDIVMKYAPVQANVAQTYGMFDGNSPYVIDRICNVKAQSFPLQYENIVDFDLVTEMQKCGDEYIDMILKFFRVEKTNQDLSDTALVFTQQLANLGIVSFEEQIMIYQLAIDFFLPDKKILFKVHPDDIMYYGYLFPESEILQGRYPAELLPFIAEKMAETSLTVFSSSVLGIRTAFRQNIFCGYDFDRTFYKTDSYYFVLDILSRLNSEEYNFYGYGVDINLMENLLKYCVPSQHKLRFTYPRHFCGKTESKSVLVIDDVNFISDAFRNMDSEMHFAYERTEAAFLETVFEKEENTGVFPECIETKTVNYETIAQEDIIAMLNNLQEENIVVFVNTKKDYCFYAYDSRHIFEEMIPVKINRTKLRREQVYYEEKPQVLFFCTKNQGVQKMIKKYKGKKVLGNTGICEEVLQMTDEQRRIIVLEGMLEATENRLQYYIRKEKEEK